MRNRQASSLWHKVALISVVIALCAPVTSGCGGNDGGECSKCDNSSDCDGDRVCRESTLGKRCFDSGDSTCKVNLGFLRYVPVPEADQSNTQGTPACRPCEVDDDCNTDEQCELTTDDFYACTTTGQVSCVSSQHATD